MPTHAATNSKFQRFYTHPITGEKVPSVTTILDAMGNPFLKYWAANFVADVAVKKKAEWEGLSDEDAYQYLKRSPFKHAKKAADTGTDIHSYAEHLLRGGGGDGDFELAAHRNAALNVRRILTVIKPVRVIRTEVTLFSRSCGYAGTADAILELPGGRVVLCDWKTSKGVYDDMNLQLAAYRYADFILEDDGTETDIPPITDAMILHVPKEGAGDPWVMRAGLEDFAAFLAVKTLWTWKQGSSDTMRVVV